MSRRSKRSDNLRLSDDNLCREFEKLEEERIKKLNGTGFKDFRIEQIEPLTENQQRVFEEYSQGNNLVLYGSAGTGKTFLMLYLALNEVLTKRYKNIVIVRSAVPSRDIGFLPGTLDEKVDVYKLPYIHICEKLLGSEDSYKRLEDRGLIVFTTSSYLRGMTFDGSIVIVDEFENCTFQECDTIMTRLGADSKIMFCGDFDQSDLLKDKDKSGSKDFIGILSQMREMKMIRFDVEDIVRSGIVKSYIIQKQKYLKR
jgi:phosphate starvation-inducible PhoH-like protein/PhoH-like ATPase